MPDSARTDGRRPLVVFVDTMTIEMGLALSAQAARRRIDTALVCGPGQTPALHMFARVVETDDFRPTALGAVLAELDATWTVRGLTTNFGPFRPEAFVAGSVAVLAQERGLPSSPVDAVYRGANKFLARDALHALGLPVGRFGLAHDVPSALACAERIGLPMVLKPITGVGSSAIIRCDTEEHVATRFARGVELLASGHYPQLRMARHVARRADGSMTEFDPATSLLAEQYFPGREASVECLALGDEVVPLVVHDKIDVDERADVVFENILVAPPERFTPGEVAELTDYATRAVQGLGLRWCFCHVELRYVDGVGPRLLEVNPRIGAGCIADSIETFCGFDVGAMALDLVLGEARVPQFAPRSTDRHAMTFVFSPRSGILRRLEGLDVVRRMPEVKAIRSGYRPGDVVGGDTEEVFLASVWTTAADGDAARTLRRRILDTVKVEIEPAGPRPDHHEEETSPLSAAASRPSSPFP